MLSAGVAQPTEGGPITGFCFSGACRMLRMLQPHRQPAGGGAMATTCNSLLGTDSPRKGACPRGR
eukprot:scaffold36298_cov122-Isochrysis_galbana.AAC.14